MHVTTDNQRAAAQFHDGYMSSAFPPQTSGQDLDKVTKGLLGAPHNFLRLASIAQWVVLPITLFDTASRRPIPMLKIWFPADGTRSSTNRGPTFGPFITGKMTASSDHCWLSLLKALELFLESTLKQEADEHVEYHVIEGASLGPAHSLGCGGRASADTSHLRWSWEGRAQAGPSSCCTPYICAYIFAAASCGFSPRAGHRDHRGPYHPG